MISRDAGFHERLLRRAEEVAGVGHWHIDVLNDNKIFWSDEIYRIHGLPKKGGVPPLDKAIEFFHPDDRELVTLQVQNAIEKAEKFQFELRLIRPDGEIRYVRSYGECDVNEAGEVVSVFGVFNDITDFKKREFEAEYANKALSRLIENIPDFIFVKDENFKIIQANSAFLSMYPEKSRDDVIGTTTVEAYPPEQAEKFLANDRIALKEGYNETVETIDFPGGERRTIVTKKVGYADDQENMYLLGISRDITDIMAYQERLKAILDANTDGVVTISEDGIVESYNTSSEHIFGYSENEMIGNTIDKLFHGGAKGDKIERYIAQGIDLDDQQENPEITALHKDGSKIQLSYNIREFALGGKKYYVNVFKDLSAVKKIEKALIDSEYTREAYADASSDGHWDWFIQDDYEYMSSHFWKMLGYDPKTKKHHPDEWKEIIFEEDLQSTLDNFNRHVETKGEHPFIQEVRYRHADGSSVDILCKGRVVEWGDDGQPIRMIGTHTDITNIKKTEKELIRSNIELERFAYIASHDLQEPLRMIRSFTGLLDEEYGHELGEDGREYIHFATDAAKRMQALIDDLLEYSRIGHQDANITEFNAADKIKTAIMQLNDVINLKKGSVVYGKMPAIYTNPLRFTRLMQNLIGNGIKYTKEGEKPMIRVRCKERENEYEFSVKDNGIGIKKEYLNKIFNIFERLHGKSEYNGTGIGLAICKKIVESFGGKIWADSKPNKGSTFYFTLPKVNNVPKIKDDTL